jgi:LmbE family N-acetylglucosaminyl deacetylase
MIEVALGGRPQSLQRILCLGSHSDDIEIGCGGTILQLLREHPKLEIWWVVLSSGSHRAEEARKSAALFLKNARNPRVRVRDFRNGYFPYVGDELKDYFEELKSACSPDIIFTHYRHDLHQDHRTVCELTWNTYRDHLIMEYEILKYDGDFGQPNCYVQLDEGICRRKIEYILRCFKTQRSKRWFTKDAFQALLRIRGVECQSPTRFAEAFYGRKMFLR